MEASDANVPKTTAEKIYEQIDKDLTSRRMPAPAVGQRLYGTADLGRRTLPARTHLYDAERLGQYVHSLTEVISRASTT